MESEEYDRRAVCPDWDFVFPDYFRSDGSLFLVDGETMMLLIAGILAFGLFIYLFIALLWPERFG